MQANESWWHREEPVVMVEVLNSTPSPTARARPTSCACRRTIAIAREAVAWTFGLSFDAYRPRSET